MYDYKVYDRLFAQYGLSVRTGNALINNLCDRINLEKTHPDYMPALLREYVKARNNNEWLRGIGTKAHSELEKAVDLLNNECVYTYTYKEHEIFARVWQSGSALYAINEDGEITEEIPDCDIVHDDQTIVWYEVEAINPDSKPYPMTMMFTELKTLEEAKAVVDKSVDYINTRE